MTRPGTGLPREGGPCVLTVFSNTGQRALVAQTCARIAPSARIVDAVAATDGVLALMTQRVDVLLIDAAWAGEFIGALERHARRCAPFAEVVTFGTPAAPHAGSRATRRLSPVRPWSDLVPVLEKLLLER